MCLNPLHIKNRKSSVKEFDHILDRFYNIVPCGYCDECQQLHSSSLRTRAVFHYLDTIKKGGCAFYYTLTFDDKHLPRFSGKPCFDKRKIQLFIKRLRKFFDNDSLTYFIVSEYGDSTYRPHHHAIFYLNYKVGKKYFYDSILKSWTYGFVKYGDNSGLITNIVPCYYLSKYVSKDSNYFKALGYHGISHDFLDSFEKFRFVTKTSLSFRPFNLQSSGFGLGMCDYISDNDIINGFVTINDAVKINNEYPIPLYILRKLLYSTQKNSKGNPVYILNDYGLKIKKKQLLAKVSKTSDRFKSLFILAEHYFDVLNYYFDSYDSFVHFVYTTLQGDDSFSSLAEYTLLYHDLYNFPFDFKSFHNDLIKYFENLSFKAVPLPFEINEDIKTKYFDYFKDYPKLLYYLNLINQRVSYENYLKRVKSYNITQFNRSKVSGKKPKYLTPKDFDKFINLKFHPLCSTMSINKKSDLYKMYLTDPKSNEKLMTLFH